MTKLHCLIEIEREEPEAFGLFAAAAASEFETERQAHNLLQEMSGFGIDVDEESLPIPIFTAPDAEPPSNDEFAVLSAEADRPSTSEVVAVKIDQSKIEQLSNLEGVTLWPNSELHLIDNEPEDPLTLAHSGGGLDCRPFLGAVTMDVIRRLLGVEGIWSDGYRGQNVGVAIIDEGVNGDSYPVVGGFSRPQSGRQPGTAPISSHGSMCAADILLAAPQARLYDYPFLGVPRSGGAMQMFQAILDQRRLNGTPKIINNSYGFVGRPDQNRFPNHEVWDLNHPLHRKVREVVASGATCFFAAGNCGADCPSGNCHPSGIGPGQSIHASNSLAEVITLAAVNSLHQRIGYSSQGPGMFEPKKPDVASYSHFFGNFGPGRPAGGGSNNFDNGTSAATPVAAGVGALLLSAFPNLRPDEIKQVLIETAIEVGRDIGWNSEYGHGIINAAAAYDRLRNR